jgi:hypothetical protein
VAGIPQNESNRVAEFNLTQPERESDRRMLALKDFARRRAIVRLLRRVAADDASTAARAAPAGPRIGSAADTALAAAVVSTYLANLRIARSLADEFGFQLLAYWQPTVMQKATRSAYEEAERAKAAAVAPLLELTYAALRASPAARGPSAAVVDLSDVLSGQGEPLYIDWMHLGETGNGLIARRMHEDVKRALTASERGRRP